VLQQPPSVSLPPASSPDALAEGLLSAAPPMLIAIGSSMRFRQSHIPNSRWSIRPRFKAVLGGVKGEVVLVADEPGLAACAAIELGELGLSVQYLAGGLESWRAAGLPLEASPDFPPDAECIDYLFFVHDRHSGNKEASRRYLEWEV